MRASTLASQPVDRLPRQPHHQIQAEVVEAGAARQADRLARPLGRMDPAEAGELAVVEGLHADAQAIRAGGANRGQVVGGRGFRVQLERHLGVGRHRERLAARRDQPADLVRREQGRRPAAEIDRVGHGSVGGATDLGVEGVDVAGLQPGVEQAAVEVAVVADRSTEGNVEIQPEHRVQLTAAPRARRGRPSISTCRPCRRTTSDRRRRRRGGRGAGARRGRRSPASRAPPSGAASSTAP